MTDAIAAGSILVEKHAGQPNSIRFGEPDSTGWTTLDGERSTFEKEVQEAGWTFFFMAGEMKTTVFGFDRQKTLHTALERLITNAKSQHCNGIEISRVTSKLLFKVPYVSVTAHARHLQKGSTFSGQDFIGPI